MKNLAQFRAALPRPIWLRATLAARHLGYSIPGMLSRALELWLAQPEPRAALDQALREVNEAEESSQVSA